VKRRIQQILLRVIPAGRNKETGIASRLLKKIRIWDRGRPPPDSASGYGSCVKSLPIPATAANSLFLGSMRRQTQSFQVATLLLQLRYVSDAAPDCTANRAHG